jgi:Domain of unknown function (DUF4189)
MRFLILLILLVYSSTVSAEGRCPHGYLQTTILDGIGCTPMYNTPPGQDAIPRPNSPNPNPKWLFRWGAIAIDDAKGKFGGVDDISDPRKAKKAAIKLCKRNGGTQCKIAVEYHNQCGTLVWGADRYVAFRGSVPDEITKSGIESCSKITTNCQIYYLGCSYAVEDD